MHEIPNQDHFYIEMHSALHSGSKLLVAEPKGHVKLAEFEASLHGASRLGFRLFDGPSIKGSRSAILERM